MWRKAACILFSFILIVLQGCLLCDQIEPLNQVKSSFTDTDSSSTFTQNDEGGGKESLYSSHDHGVTIDTGQTTKEYLVSSSEGGVADSDDIISIITSSQSLSQSDVRPFEESLPSSQGEQSFILVDDKTQTSQLQPSLEGATSSHDQATSQSEAPLPGDSLNSIPSINLASSVKDAPPPHPEHLSPSMIDNSNSITDNQYTPPLDPPTSTDVHSPSSIHASPLVPPSTDAPPTQAPPTEAPPTQAPPPTTEEGDVEKREEEFPSFTEWTQKVLAEQEKTKQESKTLTQSNIAPSVQKKLRNNFASNSCGAKVLATNPEAENVKHVLTANKDEYMINPCSAKKWFLVELCEPVQVKMIEIASLELFSSQPKSFRVFISDRYPAKEWQSLGVYDAKDERLVQSYQATSEPFVKYVRVEMIEHYGNEHFCPLTLFRLYGLPITDDDDNDEQNLQTETDIDSVLVENEEEDNKDGVRNLFMSAKDTVVNLVKKVLNVEEKKIELDRENQTEVNNKNLSADGTILPCVPSPSDNSVVDLPTVLVPTPSIKLPSPDQVTDTTDVPIVTKLDDDEQVPSSDEGNHLSDIKTCLNVTLNITRHAPICSYINTMLPFSSQMCHKDDFLYTEDSTEAVEATVNAPPSSKHVTMETKLSSASEKDDRSVGSVLSDSLTSENVGGTKMGEETQLSSTTIVGEIKSSESIVVETTASVVQSAEPKLDNSKINSQMISSTSPVDQEQSSLDSQVPVSKDRKVTTTDILLEPSSTDLSEVKVIDTHVQTGSQDIPATPTEGLDIGEETKTEKSKMVNMDEPSSSQILPDAVTPSVTASKTQTLSPSLKTEEKEKPSIELPTGEKVEEIKNNREVKKSLDLVKIPLGSIGKRETAIMRLTNRIKALELNVSLSSRFLEELSQRFKKQNDDIMKLMNKTIARLNNSTRESELRDEKQQRQLDILEARMENLTSLVDSIAQNMDTLTNKLSDRQMVWGSVELVILMVVCAVCLARGRQVRISPELKHLLETMPKQPSPHPLPRRNSVDVGSVGHSLTSAVLRKNASETALVDQSPCDNPTGDFSVHTAESTLVKEGSRKKKKKKYKSSVPKSAMFDPSHPQPPDQSSPVQISREAGILFGADAVTTLTGVGIQEVDPGPVSSSSSTVSLPAQSRKHSLTGSSGRVSQDREGPTTAVEDRKSHKYTGRFGEGPTTVVEDIKRTQKFTGRFGEAPTTTALEEVKRTQKITGKVEDIRRSQNCTGRFLEDPTALEDVKKTTKFIGRFGEVSTTLEDAKRTQKFIGRFGEIPATAEDAKKTQKFTGRFSGKQKKQQNRGGLVNGTDAKIESLKPLQAKLQTKDKNGHSDDSTTSLVSLKESRGKSRVSWLF